MEFLFKSYKVWGDFGAIVGFGCSFGGEIAEVGIPYVHYTFNLYDLFHEHIKYQV
jgi:hypothetical protein